MVTKPSKHTASVVAAYGKLVSNKPKASMMARKDDIIDRLSTACEVSEDLDLQSTVRPRTTNFEKSNKEVDSANTETETTSKPSYFVIFTILLNRLLQ